MPSLTKNLLFVGHKPTAQTEMLVVCSEKVCLIYYLWKFEDKEKNSIDFLMTNRLSFFSSVLFSS